MRVETIQDVVALAVPTRYDLTDEETQQRLPGLLNAIATWSVEQQYAHRHVKPELVFDKIDFLITNSPSDVELWQPAHDCAACRAGNDQALAFLKANPGKYIALGNITYKERWPE